MFIFFWVSAVLDQSVTHRGAGARRRAPHHMTRFTFWRPVAVALLVLGPLGCSGTQKRPSEADAALAPYSPEAAVLFDDVFAPAVFGFDPEGRHPAQDPKLKERTRQAEFVLVARVVTVSRVGGVEHHGAYEVTLTPLGTTLAGQAVGGQLVLSVSATSPSYAWLDGASTKWVGSNLVVFGRHYADVAGRALHFRCEPDSAEMRRAVEHDAGLRLLR